VSNSIVAPNRNSRFVDTGQHLPFGVERNQRPPQRRVKRGGSRRLLAVCLGTPARHSRLEEVASLEDEGDGEEREAEREGEGGGGDMVAFMGARSQQSLRSALSASGWL